MKRALEPYRPILEKLLAHAGSTEGLKRMRLLELGPGRRIHCLRYLMEEVGVEHVDAAGRVKLWPWTRNTAFLRAHVEETYLLDYLRALPSAGLDAAYSRHVMERHSIDPWILLSSRRYWGQFKGNRFSDLKEDYPSSLKNVEAVFRETYRVLKPGGLIVSLIAKRKNSGLSRPFLEGFQPAWIEEERLGARSSLVTVKKRG
jgi:hypothetical protein